MHAAYGPAMLGGQGPIEMVGVHGKSGAGCVSFDHEASVARLTHAALRTAFQKSADQLFGAVSS
ncbi:hypothetical protein XVE_0307, partial [Xanthomonas vesicatoria ATCC 35937]